MSRFAALLVAFTSALLQADEPAALRAGAATSNITPPLGGLIVGGFHPYPATHVHDELHARCLVLEQGGESVAFVVCDLLGARWDVHKQAAEWVERETGIPRAFVMISCTHTHSAASALGADRYYDEREITLDAYQTFVARRIADGVKRAQNELRPAQIAWGSGHKPEHVHNRRWFMREGSIPPGPLGTADKVKMNPPRASPDLVKPAGPVDPEVCVLSVRQPDGRPIAVLANYSLHYVGGVGPGHISADYYGVFCAELERRLDPADGGPRPVALLSNGTSGNINNIDFTKPAEKQPPYARMREVALSLADEVEKVLAQGLTEYQSSARLGGAQFALQLEARKPDKNQLARAKRLLAVPRALGQKATLELIYAERALALSKHADTLVFPLQVIRVGDLAVCGIPGEVFVETGLALKAESPFAKTFTHSLAGGYFGYLPTPEHHELGGYETWLGTCRVEKQATVKITATLLEMLRKLRE